MIKISRWEDLIGLENGKGLRIEKRTNALSAVMYGEEFIKLLDQTIKLSITVNKLKAMGFELEWKPKRTLEEVLADYTEKPFEFGKDNYVIVDRGLGLRIERYRTTNFIGAKYYSFKDAEKICEELNE